MTAGFEMGGGGGQRRGDEVGGGRYCSLLSTPDGVCRVSKYLDYAWYKQPEIIPRCNVKVNVNHKITHNSKPNRLHTLDIRPLPSSPFLFFRILSTLLFIIIFLLFFIRLFRKFLCRLPFPFLLHPFHNPSLPCYSKFRSLSIFFLFILWLSSLFLPLCLPLIIFIRLCLLLFFLYLLLLLYLFFLPFLRFLSFLL